MRLQPVATTRSILTTAEICRANGWGVGTVLQGELLPKEDCQATPPQIQITAIGLQTILAIELDGRQPEEQAWNLKTRNWTEVR